MAKLASLKNPVKGKMGLLRGTSMADIGQVEHRSKKELVYQILKDAVIDRRWTPGEKRSFSELSALLHVSRTPVAEACKLLEKEGWVIIKPQVGVEAAQLTREEITENYKIRAALEGLAGTEAIKHLREDDFRKLHELLAEMEAAEPKKDYAQFYEVNRVFHRLIYQASQMGQLIRTLDHFWDSGKRYRFFYRHLPNPLEDSNRYHRRILAALKAKDVSLARSFLEKDTLEFGKKLRRYVEKNIRQSSDWSKFAKLPRWTSEPEKLPRPFAKSSQKKM
jgi:DNA-binding GntR family transcriptional regulator